MLCWWVPLCTAAFPGVLRGKDKLCEQSAFEIAEALLFAAALI